MASREELEKRVSDLESQLGSLRATGAPVAFRGIRKRASWGIGDIPFYDVAIGPDFARGQMRGHAKGILALGDIATGVVAVGGLARGVVAFGGLAAGLLSFGGLSLGVLAAVGAWARPDQFFRAYLIGFMAWLGVTLGSMAILMLRHLTKGAWGMVIRRILGAAMRCSPLMAVLFVPLLFGLRKLYIWARPLDSIADNHLREHLQEITKSYLSVNGFIVRAVTYFAIWNLLSFLLTKWSAEQDHPPMRDNSSRFKALSMYPGVLSKSCMSSSRSVERVARLHRSVFERTRRVSAPHVCQLQPPTE